MTYVPGFEFDVFVSYAHSDDRAWIDRLIDDLRPALKRLLGIEPAFWIDRADLRPSHDFRREIPRSVCSSAVFLFFPSPSYIRSEYCVAHEYPGFLSTIPSKRARFAGADFANEQFAVRCPILPVDNNEHWTLFPGLTDIPFCDQTDTFPHGSVEFKPRFYKLAGELKMLLQRMRNHSTPVFLYPPHPGAAVDVAHGNLAAELSAQGYRILPDRQVNLHDQLREAALSVFLLDQVYDDPLAELTAKAAVIGKPWIVWCSAPALDGEPEQLGLIRHLEQIESPLKTFLAASTVSESLKELKEAVLDVLRPGALLDREAAAKPRVYLLYNSRDRDERTNAGQIAFHYKGEFQFQHPDEPAQHMARLANSDGVLLVWGRSEESWCAPEFQSMIQVSRWARARGLCLFDPPERKQAVAQQIRALDMDVHVVEQYGRFDPGRMESFFSVLRGRAAAS